MTLSSIYNDPMGLVLLTLPLLTLIVSLILQLMIKKKVIIISLVFIAYLIATFVVFNSTFLIWCFVYSVIAWVGTLIADLILKLTQKV